MFDKQNLKNTQQSLETTTATFKSKIIVFPTVCNVMVHSQSQQKEKNIAVWAILGEERQNKSGTIIQIERKITIFAQNQILEKCKKENQRGRPELLSPAPKVVDTESDINLE